MASKILVVGGANGAQDGSVMQAIKSDRLLSKTWTLPGITRNIASPAAIEVAARRVEVVAVSPNSMVELESPVAGGYTTSSARLSERLWALRTAGTERYGEDRRVCCARDSRVCDKLNDVYDWERSDGIKAVKYRVAETESSW